MASNADLIKAIEALAAELDVDVTTEGLTNVQLSEKLAELKADRAVEPAPAPAPAPAAEVKRAPFTVAAGKSVTTRRGILGDGEPITAADLGGGQGALDALVSGKYVDRNGR